MSGKIFTIRQLTEAFGVTARTIRFYESEGLIAPHRQGAMRLYSQRDRARLALILRGKRVGFSLAEIREMLALSDVGRSDSSHLLRALEKIEERISTLERQRADIDAALADLAAGRAEIELALVRLGHSLQPTDYRGRMIGYGLLPNSSPNPSPTGDGPDER